MEFKPILLRLTNFFKVVKMQEEVLSISKADQFKLRSNHPQPQYFLKILTVLKVAWLATA